MNNPEGLQPLNHSLSGLPQWVSERILQQINRLFGLLAGKNRRILRIIRNARRMVGISAQRAIYLPGRSLAQA